MEIEKVHEDERRSIHLIPNLLSDNKEFTIIKLNARKAIGGCKHIENEHFCIVSGEGTYKWRDPKSFDKKIKSVGYMAGEHAEIPAGRSHMFIAKTDSIILEWGVDKTNPDNEKKDIKFRAEVNKINKNAN